MSDKNFIVSDYSDFIFSGNPAELTFRIGNVLEVASGYATLFLACDYSYEPADGTTLILTIDGAPITFTFSDTPNPDDATYIPAFQLGDDETAYFKSVAQHIYRHPLIRANYRVALVSAETKAVIEIRARRRGKAYNIDLGAGTFVSESIAPVTFADDDLLKADLKIEATVEVITDEAFNETVLRVDNIEATGVADIDANEIEITLHELPTITKSAMGNDVPHNAYLIMPHRYNYARVTVEANAKIGGVQTKSIVQEFLDFGESAPGAMIGIKGAVPLNRWPVKSLEESFLLGQEGQKFFTWQPREKLVKMDQPEWLSFYCYESPFAIGSSDEYSLQFKLYTADGEVVEYARYFFVKVSGVWLLPVGYSQFMLEGLHGAPTSEVMYWEVSVHRYSTGISSETIRYIADKRYFNDERYFIYRNSLGGIDSLRCVGVNEFSTKYTRDLGKKVLSSTDRAYSGSIEMIYVEREELWLMRTGYLLSQQEVERLQEMFTSTWIAEVPVPMAPATYLGLGTGLIETTRQLYRSVILVQDSVNMWEEGDGQWAVEWKMKYANNERGYAELNLQEVAYDTTMEFTFRVNEANSEVLFDFDANTVVSVKINGRQIDTLNYTFEKPGLYSVIAAGAQLTNFSMSATGDIDITFKHIETFTLQSFFMWSFKGHNIEYLISRLPTLYSLQGFTIWADPIDTDDVDSLLAAAMKLYNSGRSTLGSVDIAFWNVGTAGSYIAEELNAQGVTVTNA